MYRRFVEEFMRHPRDVHTVPVNRTAYRWFYVFAENATLYVEPAHDHAPACIIKKRPLLEKECAAILAIYHRRLAGEPVSAEAQACTYSQVYWYGIFAELEI